MANTKALSRGARKAAKRRQRRELSRLWASLSPSKRREFRKSESKSLKLFVKS